MPDVHVGAVRDIDLFFFFKYIFCWIKEYSFWTPEVGRSGLGDFADLYSKIQIDALILLW